VASSADEVGYRLQGIGNGEKAVNKKDTRQLGDNNSLEDIGGDQGGALCGEHRLVNARSDVIRGFFRVPNKTRLGGGENLLPSRKITKGRKRNVKFF